MKKGHSGFSAIPVLAVVLVATAMLSGCSGASPSGGTYLISSSGGLTASPGTLTNTGGSWSFDAGTVPQYTTVDVTITVTNSGDGDFVAQGSASFSPANDITTSLSGSFTVKAHSSNSFTVSITPSNYPTGSEASPSGPENGTLTLTPSSGSPITVSVTVTPDDTFQVFDAVGYQIIPGTAGTMFYSETDQLYIYNNYENMASVSLTGSPYVQISGSGYSVSTQPLSTDFPLTADNSSYFALTDTNLDAGHSATITIRGVDSTTNTPFTFEGTLTDYVDNR